MMKLSDHSHIPKTIAKLQVQRNEFSRRCGILRGDAVVS